VGGGGGPATSMVIVNIDGVVGEFRRGGHKDISNFLLVMPALHPQTDLLQQLGVVLENTRHRAKEICPELLADDGILVFGFSELRHVVEDEVFQLIHEGFLGVEDLFGNVDLDYGVLAKLAGQDTAHSLLDDHRGSLVRGSVLFLHFKVKRGSVWLGLSIATSKKKDIGFLP